MRKNARLIIVEAILCFGLPLYFLAWGLVSTVFMLPMALNGEWFAIFNVSITCGGLLGAFSLYRIVQYLVTGQRERVARSSIPIIFAATALLGLWAVETNQFREFEINAASVLLVYAPTLASIHLLWLARSRHETDITKGPSMARDSQGQRV